MLASVYSYCVMVKSMTCCCVHGRWVISNPVTFVGKMWLVAGNSEKGKILSLAKKYVKPCDLNQ